MGSTMLITCTDASFEFVVIDKNDQLISKYGILVAVRGSLPLPRLQGVYRERVDARLLRARQRPYQCWEGRGLCSRTSRTPKAEDKRRCTSAVHAALAGSRASAAAAESEHESDGVQQVQRLKEHLRDTSRGGAFT
eukprot:6206456-Pleurochrysis_carterae.AAC.1